MGRSQNSVTCMSVWKKLYNMLRDLVGKPCIDIYLAIFDGNVDCIKRLLDCGVNPDRFKKGRETPLHFAASMGRPDVVELLIKYKADVNARDGYGMTPLHIAAYYGYAQVAKLLLDNGADPNVIDNFGLAPLHRACSERRLEVVKLLVEYGADVNIRDHYGNTPLHYATRSGCSECVKLLI